MNICIATGEYVPQPGGIATFYHALAQLLTQGGHAVTVLTSGQAGDSADRGVEVVRLEDEIARHARDVKRSLRGAAPSVIREVATGFAMQGWLEANGQRRGFDIVETPEFGGAGAFLTG
ncbi:MAG: glycosyltransferase, partial [Caldilineaceae bacterium]|nr:glycosyltransferase [Caldilineaceae bacterium]